jgi:hypothetical protein
VFKIVIVTSYFEAVVSEPSELAEFVELSEFADKSPDYAGFSPHDASKSAIDAAKPKEISFLVFIFISS